MFCAPDRPDTGHILLSKRGHGFFPAGPGCSHDRHCYRFGEHNSQRGGPCATCDGRLCRHVNSRPPPIPIQQHGRRHPAHNTVVAAAPCGDCNLLPPEKAAVPSGGGGRQRIPGS